MKSDGPVTPQRRARLEAGFSLRDLERLTGINRGALSMYERGRLLLTGEQLARVLEVLAERQSA